VELETQVHEADHDRVLAIITPVVLGEARHGDIRRELDARDAAETAHPFSGQSG